MGAERNHSHACSKICSPFGGREGANLRDRPPLITTAKVNNEPALWGGDFGLLPGTYSLQGFQNIDACEVPVSACWKFLRDFLGHPAFV